MNVWALFPLFLVLMTSQAVTEDIIYHDYVIVGAGPSGLQMGYFLKSANRDYAILERANISGIKGIKNNHLQLCATNDVTQFSSIHGIILTC